MRVHLVGHGITKHKITQFNAETLDDAYPRAVEHCSPVRNVAIHIDGDDTPACIVVWNHETDRPGLCYPLA